MAEGGENINGEQEMSASTGGNILGDIAKYVDIEIGKICVHFGKMKTNFAWGIFGLKLQQNISLAVEYKHYLYVMYIIIQVSQF
jgi:hypothetical protein